MNTFTEQAFQVLVLTSPRGKYEAWDIPRIHQYTVVLAHKHLISIHYQHTIREESSFQKAQLRVRLHKKRSATANCSQLLSDDNL